MSFGRTTIGNIRVLSPIGHGGMGDVYLGIDERLQRKVALKTIQSERRLDAAAQARFAREARILSQLDHPHICRVHDYISTPEGDVIVLEYIEGRPLTALLRDPTPLSPVEKQRIAEQIARALVAAHERGVVHRDLKPSNVMVTPSGNVKVVDFGMAMTPEPATEVVAADEAADSATLTPPDADSACATVVGGFVVQRPLDVVRPDSSDADGSRESDLNTPHGTLSAPVSASAITRPDPPSPSPRSTPSDGTSASNAGAAAFHTLAGQLLGTPSYMSPEQARGEPATPASDMFSFGLLLQALFTGVDPHPEGLNLHQTIARAAAAQTQPPGPAPRHLLALIHRLKAKAPAARPTALDALDRLRWIGEAPRRRLIRLGVATAVLLLALAGVKYTLDVRQARDRANRHRAQAEELIGFMLGDLRAKLEPVGQLALLSSTGDKALAYFAALPPGEVTDTDHFRQAQALMQVGQVRIDQGLATNAQQMFKQALATMRGLSGREPDNLPWLAALGSAHFWVGYVHWNEGRLEDALVELRAYLAVAQRLVAREPDKPEWQMELAQAQNNLGAVFQARGDFTAAVEKFREAVATKQVLVARDSSRTDWLKELADSESWLGDALRSTGDLAGSIQHHQTSAAIFAGLRQREPDNRRWQYFQIISHSKTARSMRLLRDLDASTREAEAARDLALGLTAHDPTNLDWQRELGVAMSSVGRNHLERLAGPQASAALESSVATLAAIVRIDTGNADYRRQLATARAHLSRAYELSNRLTEALRAAEEGMATLDPIRSNPTQRTLERLAEVSLARARVFGRLGRADDARRDIDQAIAATGSFSQGTLDPELLALKAEALVRAGRATDAKPALDELKRHNVSCATLEEALNSVPAPERTIH